jgi:hypothetical protein
MSLRPRILQKHAKREQKSLDKRHFCSTTHLPVPVRTVAAIPTLKERIFGSLPYHTSQFAQSVHSEFTKHHDVPMHHLGPTCPELHSERKSYGA